MNINENRLIIDTPLNESDVEDFLVTLKQSEVTEIIVDNDDLHASIIQALWCIYNEKKVIVNSEFLKPFFENVRVGDSL